MIDVKAVGDIWLQTKDRNGPFSSVSSVLDGADILFGNLETVLSASGTPKQKSHVLSIPEENICWLVDKKFSVMNIANNHILDLGEEGFANTIHALKSSSIKYIGGNLNSEPTSTVIEVNGFKIGFLGHTIGRFPVPKSLKLNKYDKKTILKEIHKLRERCDYVFLSLHWGTEYAEYPSPKQITDAHEFIDAGVSVILGHHPHVIQGIEEYHGGIIAYSLGNFQFFTNPRYQRMKYCMILDIIINDNSQLGYNVTPCVINDSSCPEVLTEKEREIELEHLSRISTPLVQNKITNGWWFEQISETYLSDSMASFKKQIREHGFKPLCILAIWLVMPFNIRCYIGLLRSKLIKFM